MGNAQAIATFLRGVQDVNIANIPNLESVIARIVDSGTTYAGEEKLKRLIDVLFDERDAIVNDLMRHTVPRIVEEVRYSIEIERTAEADPKLVFAPVSTPVSAPGTFDDLFAPIK